MAILTDKACFLHVPKTGGRFIRAALTAAGIEWSEAGDEYPPVLSGRRILFALPDDARALHSVPSPSMVGQRVVVTTIRHPADWVLSFWSHDGGREHGFGYLADLRANAENFAEFAWKLAREDPGIVGELFTAYTKRGWNHSVTVGIGASGLIQALQNAGHEFDQDVIANLDPVGVGNWHPAIGRGTFAAICESELPMILKYQFTEDYDEWAS